MNYQNLWEIEYDAAQKPLITHVVADSLDAAIMLFEKSFNSANEHWKHTKCDILSIKKIGGAHYE
jgi:hypothetical protein